MHFEGSELDGSNSSELPKVRLIMGRIKSRQLNRQKRSQLKVSQIDSNCKCSHEQWAMHLPLCRGCICWLEASSQAGGWSKVTVRRAHSGVAILHASNGALMTAPHLLLLSGSLGQLKSSAELVVSHLRSSLLLPPSSTLTTSQSAMSSLYNHKFPRRAPAILLTF